MFGSRSKRLVLVAAALALAPAGASAQVIVHEDATITSIHPAGGDDFGAPVVLRGPWLLVGAPAYGGIGEVQLFDIGPPVAAAGALVGSDSSAGDGFGGAIALDGDLLVVGVSGHDHGATDAGAAYVFRWSGSAWIQEAELLASDRAEGDGFGAEVDVSGDRIVVGAPGCDADSGALYVFELGGGVWTEVFEGTAFDGQAGDLFGVQVALDGDALVASAPLADAGWPDCGALYTFRRSGGAWTAESKHGPRVGGYGTFGNDVDLDGDLIVAGMPYGDLPPGVGTGLVYVFRWDGSGWIEEAVLQPHVGAALDWLGYSLSLQGERFVTGVPGKHGFGGEAVIFERVGDAWLEGLRLTPSSSAQWDYLGKAVSLDGDRAAIGGGWASFRVLLFSPPAWVGTSFCAGDGSGSRCPCGNVSDTWLGLGCKNQVELGGGLSGRGSASVAADDLVLTVQYTKSQAPVALFSGPAQLGGGLGTPFGNGLLCIGGGLKRLGTGVAGPAAIFGPGLQAQGGWSAGETRYFQAWYRDPFGACGGEFNTTQALAVTFTP